MKNLILTIFFIFLLINFIGGSESSSEVSAHQTDDTLIENAINQKEDTKTQEKKPFQRVIGEVSDTQLKDLIEELHDSFILVKFYSTWCPWSIQYAPVYESMIETFPNISVVSLDSSKYPSLNWKFSVSALPKTLLFFNSSAYSRFPGSNRTYENLRDFVQEKTKENPVVIQTIPQLPPLEESPETNWMLLFSCFFVLSTRFLPFVWGLFKRKPHQE